MEFLRQFVTPKGKRLVAALIAVACAAALAVSATGSRPSFASPSAPTTGAYVPAKLLASARANPGNVYRVILQGAGPRGETRVVSAVRERGAAVDRRLSTISGAAATVTGRQLQQLASASGIAAISLDQPVKLAGTSLFSNPQQWTSAVNAQRIWSSVWGLFSNPPSIAFVDSGIQNRLDFLGRLTRQVSISNGVASSSQGDAYGHGTFVAGIAADSLPGHTGVLPNAPLVSIDVMNDQGMALTSDVIAACDWIVRHKESDNIRVANFSLHSTAPASVFWDPLDRAVEKLWFDGITVVAASGNYGTGVQPSGVLYAPGNDPFVITVGAADLGASTATSDDTAAPWSAWGYTYDGFAKPELAAPGRYMIGPSPTTSTLTQTRPDAVVSSGYLQLSGTSFAAPVVSAAADALLAAHPNWMPDQVKGALMLGAQAEPNATVGSLGVGLVDIAGASQVASPPNPNKALDDFLVSDPNGGSIPVFNTSAWQSAAQTNPSWDAAAWGSAAWGSAAWGSAAWGSAAWGSAAWGSAAWGSAAWGSAAWGSSTLAQNLAATDAAWGSAAWGSSAAADIAPGR